MVRERLWRRVCRSVANGGGILVHSADNEQGFEVHFCGNIGRTIRDFEGIQLVQNNQIRS